MYGNFYVFVARRVPVSIEKGIVIFRVYECGLYGFYLMEMVRRVSEKISAGLQMKPFAR